MAVSKKTPTTSLPTTASYPALARARSHLVDAILTFLGQGMHDRDLPQEGNSLDNFRLLLEVHMLKQVAGTSLTAAHRPVSRAYQEADDALARVEAYRTMLGRFKDACRLHFGSLPAPALGFLSVQDEDAVCLEVTGQALAVLPAETQPIRQAYEMARYNAQRFEQRIGMLYALASIVRVSYESKLPNTAAQANYEEASRQFWTTRALHLSRMLAFGTLLGGDYLEQNKALVKQMYGEGMSIVEMLEIDGAHPGRHPAGTDAAFRKAIAEA